MLLLTFFQVKRKIVTQEENTVEKEKVQDFYKRSEFCSYQTHFVNGMIITSTLSCLTFLGEGKEFGTIYCSLKQLHKLYLESQSGSQIPLPYRTFTSWRPENIELSRMQMCMYRVFLHKITVLGCCPRCKSGYATFSDLFKQLSALFKRSSLNLTRINIFKHFLSDL